MKIEDKHQFHGAALMQIAEDSHFTAINVVPIDGKPAGSAFRVNVSIGVYLKYATKPVNQYKEYCFGFKEEQIKDLEELKRVTGRVFLALVCIEGREICCLPYRKFLDLVERRRQAKKENEAQYVILLTLERGSGFQVYINRPGRKGKILGKPMRIKRSDFPKKLFEDATDA